MMREWSVQHDKSFRQRTVREETTKFKFGALPLNMYRSSPLDYPKEEGYLFQTNEKGGGGGGGRNKKKKTRKFLPAPRRKSRTSKTRTVKMKILWKKMMTMIPLHL